MNARMTSVAAELETIEFVTKAAEYFAAHPECSTFGELQPDSLLALRWGLGEDCVMVVRLHEYQRGVIYQQAIKRKETK